MSLRALLWIADVFGESASIARLVNPQILLWASETGGLSLAGGDSDARVPLQEEG